MLSNGQERQNHGAALTWRSSECKRRQPGAISIRRMNMDKNIRVIVAAFR